MAWRVSAGEREREGGDMNETEEEEEEETVVAAKTTWRKVRELCQGKWGDK